MSDPSESEVTLLDHLTELRARLIKSAIAIFLTTLLCWIFSDELFDIVRAPILNVMQKNNLGEGLVFTAPMDKFLAHLKVSLYGGVVLSCPYWLYQAWKFIAPGLYQEEKKYGKIFVLTGSLLFLMGVSFVYFLVYPMTFDYLLGFGGDVDRPMITIDHYLSFFFLTTIVFGLAFELPLILSLLGAMGLVTQDFMRNSRRYAIVLLAVLSAVITPPDLISMIMLMIPLMGLYEISIYAVGFFEKRRLGGEDLDTE